LWEVEELMPGWELAAWKEFFAREPLPEVKADVRAANMVVAALMPWTKHPPDGAKLFPWQRGYVKAMTPEELRLAGRTWAAQRGDNGEHRQA
jgi:hypothetical protein